MKKKPMKIDQLLRSAFPDEMKRVDEKRCPFCGQPVEIEGFRDKLSRHEYEISGICQHCQDETFGL